MVKYETVDAYLQAVENADYRRLLDRIRSIIREEAPDAQECISYGMPGYKLNGPLVYFAAFKKHLSLFPAGIVAQYATELASFKTSKGTIQFTPESPLPEELIRRIVRDRVQENRSKKRS